MVWGYHTLFDCKSCPVEKFTEENIRSFIKNIVWKIDMKAYGDPMIAHFATHNPAAAGYSFCQMIETSNITGHFVDETGDCYIDIFSCKDYDKGIAKEVINKFFKPRGISMKYIERSV
jgi:S-adenosylmethionine/arginine decarboxylase-like enzyme|tara:strand:+ start:2539 stop:2892 length:354 start_codon:yes stop_codon:yes gene_type:complete